MKANLKTTLSISYLAVVLIAIGLASLLTWLAVERIYLETQANNLVAQANLLAAAVKEPLPPTNPIPYSQLSNIASGIHTRVIDAQGAAIIELGVDGARTPAGTGGVNLPELAQNPGGWVTPEDLFNRPEISQALQGTAAWSVRRIGTAGGRPVLYAAAPVLSANGTVAQIVYLAMPLPDTQWAALPAGVRWQLVLILVSASVLAACAGLIFAKRISEPLQQISRTVETISGGNFNQPAPETSSLIELQVLSQGINRMARSLQQSDLAKAHFIAGVSHELRTPLTVIKGTIETLQDGALDDLEARGPFLEAMGQETERLIRLVNDLLVLTRADARELKLQIKPVSLEELARERCRRLEEIARPAGVRLSVEATPSLEKNGCPPVLADPDRTAQVLDNLLANAIRYSPPGGEVRVCLTRESEGVLCQVIDEGPGIPVEHLPFLFDRFYRVDPSRGKDQGGSGLGLAIVKELVEAQGGKTSITSTVGQGSIFQFWLPFC